MGSMALIIIPSVIFCYEFKSCVSTDTSVTKNVPAIKNHSIITLLFVESLSQMINKLTDIFTKDFDGRSIF